MFYFSKKDRDFARSFFSGKFVLAAAGPTIDSLSFGQVEIASDKLILATVGPTSRLLKKLISIPEPLGLLSLSNERSKAIYGKKKLRNFAHNYPFLSQITIGTTSCQKSSYKYLSCF